MRKSLLIALLLLLPLVLSLNPDFTAPNYTTQAIQKEQQGAGAVGPNSPFMSSGWTTAYRTLALYAAVAVALITALAYFAGSMFESETLKSWGRMELGQAIATALLLLVFIGVIETMNWAMEATAVNLESPCGARGAWDYENAKPNPIPPGWVRSVPPGTPRATQYAVCYVDRLYSLGNGMAETQYRASLDYARKAYESTGFQATNWILLYLGAGVRYNADLRLNSEMASLKFDIISKMLISLTAQKFFVGGIAAFVGPVCLLIGVVLRAFSFTRKAGGMLMAIAAGLLVILPSAYLLAWLTLSVAVYGNSALGIDNTPAYCPAECKLTAPVAYKISDGKQYQPKEFAALSLINASTGWLLKYTDAEGLFDQGYQSCFPDKNYPLPPDTPKITNDTSASCPTQCRELPFPYYAGCEKYEEACGKIPEQCKVIRQIGVHPTKPPKFTCNEYDEDEGLGCSASCPDVCRNILPQINYTNPDAYALPGTRSGTTPIGVAQNNCGVCAGCPDRCRQYDRNTGKLLIADLQGNDWVCARASKTCDACYGQFDSGNKACFTGVSSIQQGCNAPSMCGALLSLDTDPPDSVCPMECRVFFEDYPPPPPPSGTNYTKYIDKTYADKCLGKSANGKNYTDACNKCPSDCKVNATAIPGIGSTSSYSLLRPPSASCSDPPKFDAADNYKQTVQKCEYCPVACRFINPSPLDVIKDPFLSKSNLNSECSYETTGTNAQGSSQQECDDLQDKRGYRTRAYFTEYAGALYKISLTIDGVTSNYCSPYSTVYPLASSSNLCPKYFSGGGLLTAPGNSKAAPECLKPGVEAACADNACPSTCKANWPPFCTLEDPNDKNSRIFENELGACNQCSTVNPPQNTTGPQCQVKLRYDILPPENPSLCDASCRNSQCKQSCFPILDLPTTSPQCGLYADNSDPAKDETDWKNCASCPYDCRYDYKGTPPKDYNKYCGINLTANLSNRNYGPPPWYPPDPNQKYWICDPTYSQKCDEGPNTRVVTDPDMSDCRANGYICNFAARTTDYWNCLVTDLNSNIFAMDHPCWGNFLLDSNHGSACYGAPDDWYNNASLCPTTWRGQSVATTCDLYEIGSCGLFYNNQPNDYYNCSFKDPYPGLNKFLNDTLNITVCGQLNDMSGKWNWCGNASNGTNSVAACNLKVNPPNSDGCSVPYDARGASCQAATTSPPPATNSSCLGCPSFCRIEVIPPTAPAYCSNRYSGFGTACSSVDCGANCRVKSSDPSPQGLDIPSCSAPNSNQGALCPARCRLRSDYYSGPLFDCPASCAEVVDDCKAPVPKEICELCQSCETDCMALPMVRQRCDESCQPDSSDILDFDPASMLSNWKGAQGDPANRAIGSLGIAAIVLPIFAFIIVIAFVRVLSPLLGGDIEVPGVLRFL